MAMIHTPLTMASFSGAQLDFIEADKSLPAFVWVVKFQGSHTPHTWKHIPPSIIQPSTVQ